MGIDGVFSDWVDKMHDALQRALSSQKAPPPFGLYNQAQSPMGHQMTKARPTTLLSVMGPK